MSADAAQRVPSPDGRAPAWRLPAGATDTHCHIWGPLARFPYAEGRTYTPPERDKQVLRQLHQRLGIERVVVVQPIVHGTDNRVTLDAIADDPVNYRGIALVEPDASESHLAALHAGGIRGVRFSFVRHLKARPDLGATERTARKIAALGWHAVVHLDAADIGELAPFLRALPVPVVIDHMGRIDAGAGLDQQPLRDLVALAAHPNCWVKVSGADRVSVTGGAFEDVVPIARALMQAAPDRVLWGTDFPHPNPRQIVHDDADLVDVLARFGDEAALRRLLVDNPARLYGFPPA